MQCPPHMGSRTVEASRLAPPSDVCIQAWATVRPIRQGSKPVATLWGECREGTDSQANGPGKRRAGACRPHTMRQQLLRCNRNKPRTNPAAATAGSSAVRAASHAAQARAACQANPLADPPVWVGRRMRGSPTPAGRHAAVQLSICQALVIFMLTEHPSRPHERSSGFLHTGER